ncbi:putative inhibitor of cysteine peptidase [Blattamonas nauphoetae]|uniref:Inhibitor of cysteine peptidase n=1 Tax=Blattamonas nauphoetae TaxID=2049346 RepID=A0ABQ9X6I3_9EUKA|nr:putative inhibitor of cysteine peptidase [Blattamonas nauphoetae]
MITAIIFWLVSESHSQLHEMNVKSGETFTIEFPASPTTGYTWHMLENQSNTPSIATLLESVYRPDHPATDNQGHQMCGGGGIQKFVFKASSKGTNDLQFVYKRSWENTNPAPEVYRVTVS